MKILVTGAAGFIGFHVAQRLLRDGACVVGFDNMNSYYDPRLKEARLELLRVEPQFEFIKGNLEERAQLAAAFARSPFDAVVHLAAQAGVRHSINHPEAYVQSNIVGFSNILEECRSHKIPHLLYASSSSVYGLNTRTPFSTSHSVDHPVSLYAATKRANELMAHSYSHLFGLPTSGLRFFTVYGPWGRPDMAYFSFTKAILEGRSIQVFNQGKLWRDFTYIADVVEAIQRLIRIPPEPDRKWNSDVPDPKSSSAPYRLYNVGNHQPTLLTDFIGTLEKIIGRTARIEQVAMQSGDVFRTCADTTDLRAVTGFAPKTSLNDGLSSFYEWYQQYAQ